LYLNIINTIFKYKDSLFIFLTKNVKNVKNDLKKFLLYNKMELSCQYCNKIFGTKGSLKTHQLKTKYCLKLQNVCAATIYSCTSCSKTFTIKSSYDRHLMRHIKDPNTIKLKNEIEELKIKHSDETLKNALEQVKFLQDHILQLSMKAVSTPKNTYNTVNIENFTAMTHEHLDDNSKNLTIDHINKGPRGYAEYMINYPCKDSLIVTDIARMIFKYKDENNKLCVDIAARNLINKISKSLDQQNRALIRKSFDDINADDKLDTVEKMNKMAVLAAYCDGIKFMDGTPTEFTRRLGRELMMLTPKKSDCVIKEIDDEKNISDVESEIIYYSD